MRPTRARWPLSTSCNETWTNLIANVGVLFAAGGSYWLVSRWPDIIVGGVIASLFLSSALGVLSQAIRALRTPLRSAAHAVKPAASHLSNVKLRNTPSS